MDWYGELTQRVAARYLQEHGPMSEGARQELMGAVAADVDSFVDHPADRAFAMVAQAQAALAKASADDEFLSDDEYMASRARRLERLCAA